MPGVDVHEEALEPAITGARGRPDATLTVRLAHRELRVIVQCKRALYPRDAREALWNLHSYRSAQAAHQEPGTRNQEPGAEVLIAAGTISEGAREFLRSEGAAYFQAGGTLFFQTPGIYIDFERPAPKSSLRTIKSLFTGRRAKVVHAILHSRDRMWGTLELAKSAQVSPGTASQVLNELEQQEWAEAKGKGPRKTRWIGNPGRLLDAWLQQVKSEPPTPLRRYFVPAKDNTVLLRDLAEAFEEAGVEYALTHEAAANQYSPFLTHVAQVRARVRPGPALDRALGTLKAREVSEGANLALIDDPDGGTLLFREKIAGAWLASPYRVYLDLLAVEGQGRGKELAQHLRHEKIGI